MTNGNRRKATIKRVIVIANKRGELERLVQWLSGSPSYQVEVVESLAGIDMEEAASRDILIVWHDVLRRLDEDETVSFLGLSRRTLVLVALQSQRLLEAAPALRLADAWIFTDMPEDLIADVLKLSESGYSVMPRRDDFTLSPDALRFAQLGRLSRYEWAVLQKLKTGASNRSMAADLDIPESLVKTLVRRILLKLHFRNRTEAGVFMVRHGRRIREQARIKDYEEIAS